MSTVETLPPGVESVLDELLKLPAAQRLLVADRLIESVPPPPLGPEWEAEIARRIAAYEADPSIAIPWEDVKREIEQLLQDKREKRQGSARSTD